ncbi:hypothetical protein E8E15_000353, partial [Penicillium rubens]
MREFDVQEFLNRHDDIQNTPLDYAITTSSSTIVDILISAGARIDDEHQEELQLNQSLYQPLHEKPLETVALSRPFQNRE